MAGLVFHLRRSAAQLVDMPPTPYEEEDLLEVGEGGDYGTGDGLISTSRFSCTVTGGLTQDPAVLFDGDLTTVISSNSADTETRPFVTLDLSQPLVIQKVDNSRSR